MAVTPVNSEDRLVQATFAAHLEQVLGWDSIYAGNEETFGPDGTLGRTDTRQAVLTRDLRAAMERLNPDLPASAIDDAMRDLTVYDVSRSMVQHNREFYRRYCQVDVERANLSRRADFVCSHRTAQVTSCQTMKARSRSSR